MAEISASSWSEVDASNNQAAPLGWDPGVMLPTEVEPTAQAMMGGTKRFWDRINATVTTTGAAGTYTYTPLNASYPTGYVQGETFVAKANKASAGGDVFNVSGLGNKPMYDGTTLLAIVANQIISGQMFSAKYDSALNSGGGGFQIFGLSTTSGFLLIQSIILATGTYTPHAGLIFAKFRMVGSGAGGFQAAAGNFGGGGGGAGEYAEGTFSAATIGASQAVTVPAGGAVSTNGATTSLGALLTALGGVTGASLTGGLGGTGGSGGIRSPGGSGGNANLILATPQLGGGQGGASAFGSGGRGGTGQLDSGLAGQPYGSGGGGNGLSTGTFGTAGAGAKGAILVDEYI